MHTEHWLRIASGAASLLCLLVMIPAVYRLVRGRGRYLDPIWAMLLLLSVNRLSFLLRVSPTFSLGSALLLALVLAPFAVWYQRHDA